MSPALTGALPLAISAAVLFRSWYALGSFLIVTSMAWSYFWTSATSLDPTCSPTANRAWPRFSWAVSKRALASPPSFSSRTKRTSADVLARMSSPALATLTRAFFWASLLSPTDIAEGPSASFEAWECCSQIFGGTLPPLFLKWTTASSNREPCTSLVASAVSWSGGRGGVRG